MKDSPHPTDKHVGSRVRMRRLMLNLSQTQLADELGVTFQQVQKCEKGKNRVSASRLQQISYVLGVPIPFFFEGLLIPKGGSKQNTDPPSPAYVNDFLATSDGLSLVKSFFAHQEPQPSTRRSQYRQDTRRRRPVILPAGLSTQPNPRLSPAASARRHPQNP